jgi:hypothetical protein
LIFNALQPCRSLDTRIRAALPHRAGRIESFWRGVCYTQG